jgi:hypothetical protein
VAETPDPDFAQAINRALDVTDVRELRALQRELGERWPDAREAWALTRMIQRKIERLMESNRMTAS